MCPSYLLGWITPPRLHGVYSNHYCVLNIQACDGVVRRFLFAESSPILCQSREREREVNSLVNRAFLSLGFRLRADEGGVCTNVHGRVRFLPDIPDRL